MKKIIFLIPLVVESASLACYINPYVGIFYPRDTILQSYFDRNSVFIYGVSTSIICKEHNVGLSTKLQRFSFNVFDAFAVNDFEPVSGTWFTIGIEKAFSISLMNFYGRLSGTLHYDSYDIFIGSLRFGFQPAFGFKINITKYIKPSCEINYEYEKLSIDDYMTMIYSRHQAYLAGKDFNAGGILLQAGFSFALID